MDGLTLTGLISLAVTIIGAVVWFVRIEGRTNLNAAEIVALRLEHSTDIRDLKDDVRALKDRLSVHIENVGIHHNSEATGEFRLALEHRLTGIDNTLADISRKINHIAGRD